MERKGKQENSLKKFLFIYIETVRLAWNVRKDLFIIITFMGALMGILVLPSLYIDKLLIDNVLKAIATHDVETGVKSVSILICLIVVIDFIKTTWSRFEWSVTQSLARCINTEIDLIVNRKINMLPVKIAEDPLVRDKYRKIYDKSATSVWSMVMPMAYLPNILFSILSALIAVTSYSFWYVLPAIVLTIPEILVGMKNSKEMHRMESQLSSLWRVWQAYDDFLSKGRYIYENKILGQVDLLTSKSRQLADTVVEKRYRRWINSSKRRTISSVPVWIFSGFVRGYFFIQAILGKITLGTAQMQYRAVSELIYGFGGLGRQMTEIYENYLFVRDYKDFMDIPEETEEGLLIEKPFKKGIEFRNVWFRYPQGGWVLKGVSFKVEPTDNIAIVGRNGAGKTTIIKLLCQFYFPQKGEIFVNGKNIKEYSPLTYRKVVSALFQDFAQYPFSARDNIGYGDIARVGEVASIEKAARLVGIDEFIENLPKKYDNPLDNEFEGGIEPSKGQWQRLALARALFREAEIFILDEPTSNVDPEAEEEIFDKIIKLEKEKIVVLVSHRFSTVRKADKILLLDKGVVQEYGSHTQLMKNDKTYAKLFKLQAKSYTSKR